MGIYFKKTELEKTSVDYDIKKHVKICKVRDVAQLGSAPDWGSGGRWFKSSHPDHFPNKNVDRGI